jgi:hypothetical protein
VNGEGALGANRQGALGTNVEGALKVNRERSLKVGGGVLAGASMDVVRACRKGSVVAHCLIGAGIHQPHHLSPP